MRIADVLRSKSGGPEVVTVPPQTVVADLLDVLARHGIGAAIVSEDGTVVGGIVSERDVVRGLARRGPEVLRQPVRDIMTAEVHCAAPEDAIEDLMSVMTERRFRHVPVLVDGALAGVVSIGDVVKSRLGELEIERDSLASYVSSATT